MRTTDSRKARNAVPRVASWGAALLVVVASAAPVAAQQKSAAPTPSSTQTAPKPDPVAVDKSQAAPKPDAAAKPAPAPGPQPEPAPIVIVRTEVYGAMITRLGKVATFTSLVATSSTPPPVGAKGILLRKVEKPGDPSGSEWLEVAEISIKKIDATGKYQVTIENERKDALINGKKANHFAKGTKMKIQIDRPG